MLLFACQGQQPTEESSMGKYHTPDDALYLDEEIEMEPPRSAENSSEDIELEKGSKIIKVGHLGFEVSNLERVKAQVDSLVNDAKGYLENEQFSSSYNRNSYTLRIRVPNDQFDSLIDRLEKGAGKLTSKSINSRDVTEEFVDINLRLKNKLSYLEQYQTILKKARTIKEILEVQEKIRRIEEEIESKKGRLKYLQDKVQYSTVNLELSELISTEISNRPSYLKRFGNAFVSGVHSFLDFAIGMVSLWPFMILIVFLWIGVRTISRRYRRGR